jgi:hypothetical protein
MVYGISTLQPCMEIMKPVEIVFKKGEKEKEGG